MYTIQCYNVVYGNFRTVCKHISLERALTIVRGRIAHSDADEGFYSFRDGSLIWRLVREVE